MNDILLIESLFKSYQCGIDSLDVLKQFSLVINEPQIIAIVGASGSGKSTLLSLIARFDKPDSGSIIMDGLNINEISEIELDNYRNRKLGFVFQQFNLLNVLTACENVELALIPQNISKRERQRRAAAILQCVGLGDRLNHKPYQLSGGQQQRVAIARALVTKPQLVLADEPTGNLDRETARGILILMKELCYQMHTTFIIATHDQNVMLAADRSIHLQQ